MAIPDATSAPQDVPATPTFNVSSSVLDDLRASRARLGSGAKPLDLEIPGFNGALVARYQWKPMSEVAATAKSLEAIKNQFDQQLAAAADTLIACNEEILVRDGDKLESLLHEGLQVTFTNSAGLCLILGLPAAPSARMAVIAIFGNEYGLRQQADRLAAWLEDTTIATAEDHLGE